MLLTMLLALACMTAAAEEVPAMKNSIPAQILDLFEAPAWAEYHVPTATDYPAYYAFVMEEYNDGSAAAMIILREESEERNVLCLLEKTKDRWRITGRNHEALPRGEAVPYLYQEIPGQFEVHWGSWEDGTTASLYFRLESDEWLLTEVNDESRSLRATVHGDGISYAIYGANGRYQYTASAEGVYDRSFEAFQWAYFPVNVEEARAILSNPPQIPGNFLHPVEVDFRTGEKYDVYAAPGRGSYRPAGGKAEMSTNDWVQVFGEENGWLLVQYDISSGQMRFGYISAEALPANTGVRELEWASIACETAADTWMTDDPLNSCKTLLRLQKGEGMTCLASMGTWMYVETQTGGRTIRGFVPAEDVLVVTPEGGWDSLYPNG